MDEQPITPKLSTELSESSTIIQSATNQVEQSIQRKPRNYDKKVHGKRLGIAAKIAVAAMQSTGMTATAVADAVGCDKSTIVRAWDNPELAELAPNIVQRTKAGLGGLFYKRSLQALLAMTPEKYADASLLQIATTSGIMVDKARLMEGLSTENVSFRGIAQSLESDREKIMKRIEELG